jgi:HTH-type transcriptional regulator/antitoxin HigA
MNIKIIKTAADYTAAMARLSELMDKDIAPNSPEDDELALLSLVIESYESQIVQPDPIE